MYEIWAETVNLQGSTYMLQVTGHRGHYSLASHSDSVLYTLLGKKIPKIWDCEVKGEGWNTPRSSAKAVTLHKSLRWLSFPPPWLITFTATLITQSCSLWGLPENGKNQSPHCDQKHNKAPLRPLQKAPDVQCFLWQLNRCAIPEQPPQMTFSYYTPKALSSTVWLLADSCCKCRVLSCSSYLPSHCYFPDSSKSNLFSSSLPLFFPCLIFPFVILATSFLLNPLTVSGCRSTKATNKS